MAGYKNRFTSKEMKQFELIKRQETREVTMSVYSKMKKYADPSNGFVCRTVKDIARLITRASSSITLTRSEMYKYINKLLKLELITKGELLGEYYITSMMKKDDDNGNKSSTTNTENQHKNVVDQQLQMVLENHKDEIKTKNNTNTPIKSFKKDIVPIVEVIKTTKDMLKTLNLKKSSREFIEKLIKNRLVDYNIQVNRVGLENYIRTMVKEKLTFLCGFSGNRTERSVIRALECLA